ncbi:retrovirus-related Pol polyprotein from transposon 297 [Trichonephila clavata]|uniref:Retrovirus-related Pol polyprotein from transposon 297 n=1 Tax=Trichonephila clavata TaxID=2740835 RepID=A0A8X6GWL4_TRICU|nr:retrovirus-related Pol polyprotein from transposon 297 [Trichonephila clavata]
MLATELGLAPSDNLKIIELKDLITNSDGYDEEFVKDVLNVIVEERTTTEKQKAMELEDKQKAVAVAQQQEREFELEKLRIQLEMQKLSQAPVTFKKKEEFRKPFPIKKSQPVGGYHDNQSPGPSRTVPRFPSSRTEGRKPIQCYGCGTPGVVKSKCPTCTRTNEMETEVNCMTLFNLNSDLYPSSVIVLKIFGVKIAVCADTGASHTIADEKLFKFLQEHGITFTNKVISFMMADGIRQTITALRTVVDLYIEGKVIPTEFLVLPEAKGNKTLLGLDFLNAAGIVLDVQGGKWNFSENPRKHYIFFKKTLKDLNISRFAVKFPFRDSSDELGSSRDIAVHRLQQIECRFRKNQYLSDQYHKFMDDYLKLRHMELIPENEIDVPASSSFYLPYHPVPNRNGDKFSVVFDGSAKSSSGVSLNEN